MSQALVNDRLWLHNDIYTAAGKEPPTPKEKPKKGKSAAKSAETPANDEGEASMRGEGSAAAEDAVADVAVAEKTKPKRDRATKKSAHDLETQAYPGGASAAKKRPTARRKKQEVAEPAADVCTVSVSAGIPAAHIDATAPEQLDKKLMRGSSARSLRRQRSKRLSAVTDGADVIDLEADCAATEQAAAASAAAWSTSASAQDEEPQKKAKRPRRTQKTAEVTGAADEDPPPTPKSQPKPTPKAKAKSTATTGVWIPQTRLVTKLVRRGSAEALASGSTDPVAQMLAEHKTGSLPADVSDTDDCAAPSRARPFFPQWQTTEKPVLPAPTVDVRLQETDTSLARPTAVTPAKQTTAPPTTTTPPTAPVSPPPTDGQLKCGEEWGDFDLPPAHPHKRPPVPAESTQDVFDNMDKALHGQPTPGDIGAGFQT